MFPRRIEIEGKMNEQDMMNEKKLLELYDEMGKIGSEYDGEEEALDGTAYDVFAWMKMDKKFRPKVKKLAAKGNAKCAEALVFWDEHVRSLRRMYASRRD